MKNSSLQNLQRRFIKAGDNSAGARIVILVFAVFLVGLGIGAFWVQRSTQSRQAKDGAMEQDVVLSEQTLAVLAKLSDVVEVRFYSVLADPEVRNSTGPFAERVARLLTAMERKAAGKIRLSQTETESREAMKSSTADGITPFNLEKGDACSLGIAFINGDRKEQLPRLVPEWESALELDITRAIARVTAPVAKPAAAAAAPVDHAISGEVKQLIPNANAVSMDDGRRILREAALKEFTDAAKGFQEKIKEAEDRFMQLSQNGASEGELKIALEQVRKLQTERAEKLDEIATRTQARIAAFEQQKIGAQ